jgi:hypothetical protein
MDKTLKGKMLVRKSKLHNGKDVLILSGIFFPTNFKIEDVCEGGRDEMWVAEISINEEGLRFTNTTGSEGNYSIEDWLEGNEYQHTDSWKNKLTKI